MASSGRVEGLPGPEAEGLGSAGGVGFESKASRTSEVDR